MLDIECTFSRKWQQADVVDATRKRSKKDTALRLVASRGEVRDDQAPLRAPIKVLALEPDDTLAYLAARLGANEDGRLFALWTVAELYRVAADRFGDLDRDAFRMTVARSGFVTEVCDGLAIADQLLGDRPAEAAAALACRPRQPRVLEWARYGPGALMRRTGFKRAFFMLYSLKLLRSRRERASYLGRALAGGRDHRPFAHSVLIELARGGATALRASSANARDLAVWIEPAELHALAAEGDVQEDDEREHADGEGRDLVSGDREQRDDSA